MKISIIIPVYNEETVIKHTVETLKNYLDENFDFYEIIVVNDGSTDKSGEILKNIPYVTFVDFIKNRGKGCAVKKGVEISDGDIVIFTDADLCYGTEHIKTIAEILKTSDIAIGSRGKSRNGYTFLRRVYSHVFDDISTLFLGKKIDAQCGIKGFSSTAAKNIFPLVKTNGFAFDFEVLYLAKKLGEKTKAFPVAMQKNGKSTVRIFKEPFFMIFDIFKIICRDIFGLYKIPEKDEFANEKTNL